MVMYQEAYRDDAWTDVNQLSVRQHTRPKIQKGSRERLTMMLLAYVLGPRITGKSQR